MKVILVNGLVTFVILNFQRNMYLRFFNISRENASKSLKGLPAIERGYSMEAKMPGENTQAQSSMRWPQH